MKKIKEFSKKLEVLYKIFNWTWLGNPETPTAKQIEKTILNLIKSCQKKDTLSSSTGGIVVKKENDDWTWEISWRLEETLYLDINEVKQIKPAKNETT